VALGPGKYDDACTAARIATGARGVLLIVLAGRDGSGFSVQCMDAELAAQIPEILEATVREIRDKIGHIPEILEAAAREIRDKTGQTPPENEPPKETG
jgi:hypothetical protein